MMGGEAVPIGHRFGQRSVFDGRSVLNGAKGVIFSAFSSVGHRSSAIIPMVSAPGNAQAITGRMRTTAGRDETKARPWGGVRGRVMHHCSFGINMKIFFYIQDGHGGSRSPDLQMRRERGKPGQGLAIVRRAGRYFLYEQMCNL
jgi:hypothetical protein